MNKVELFRVTTQTREQESSQFAIGSYKVTAAKLLNLVNDPTYANSPSTVIDVESTGEFVDANY